MRFCIISVYVSYFFLLYVVLSFFFFFQAEDGIRDVAVTGVQTCALPISSRLAAIGIFLLALLAPGARSQVHGAGRSAVVQGTVSDSELSPLKDADVSLESADHAHKFVTRSDAHGRYLFAGVPPGSYTLHGSKTGYLEGDHRPFVLSADESKIVDVRLSKAGSASAATQAFSEIGRAHV